MLSARKARVLASAAAAVSGLLSVSFSDPMAIGIDRIASSPWYMFLTGLASATASWFVFPALGRTRGPRGMLEDLSLVVVAVGLAGAIAGTLVFPVFGTIAGVVLVYMMPLKSVTVAVIYATGALLALRLARLKVNSDQ